MIDLFNYRDSKSRNFDLMEIYTCMNGFVIGIGSCEKWGSFDNFVNQHREYSIYDHYSGSNGMREVIFEREGLTLGMMLSPVSGGIKYRTVNGRVVQEDKFKATGFDSLIMPWY